MSAYSSYTMMIIVAFVTTVLTQLLLELGKRINPAAAISAAFARLGITDITHEPPPTPAVEPELPPKEHEWEAASTSMASRQGASPLPSRGGSASSSWSIVPSAEPAVVDDERQCDAIDHLNGDADCIEDIDRRLDPVVIAHSTEAQRVMDSCRLSWGVQYELARGVTNGLWSWQDVMEKASTFVGSNADNAYKVFSQMSGTPLRTVHDMSIWQELDREQAALIENQGRGLGLRGTWHGVDDWYGGQVQQTVRIVKPKGEPASFRLQPLEKRRSHRFARFTSSRRILILRIPQEKDEELQQLCRGRFILCGRVFVPFHTKDENIYLVETSENWERVLDIQAGDALRISFQSFLHTFNSMDRNIKQPASKWVTRWALGLSNTIPALEFSENNIFYLDDEYATGWDFQGKAPAHVTMTDGCGFINKAGLRAISKRLHFELPPTAIQGRVAGAKGLWILHPDDELDEPRIWIRESQRKIHLGPTGRNDMQPWHQRVHRIFDFLCASRLAGSTHISTQTIFNLSCNGVSNVIFVSLLINGLRLEIEPFLDWTRPNATVLMWDAINKAGHVVASRMQRTAQSRSRALGFQRRDYGDTFVESSNSQLEPEAPELYTGRALGGNPILLYEALLELLQAGFGPGSNSYVLNKFQSMVKLLINSKVEDFRIPIQRSVQAFMIPDPLGVLKEGEIYYRPSQPILDQETGNVLHVLTGEVLIGRYPLRVASDIQKVVAVDAPSLYCWSDVIILPTVGSRSLASCLSGGDYDGDTLFAIWEPSLLVPFHNGPLILEPADFISKNFNKKIEGVTDFKQRLATISTDERGKEFQNVLLSGSTDFKVGMYSKYHDCSVFMNGYNAPETTRLAFMFNTLLDSSKTGLRLKSEVAKSDSTLFNRSLPACFNGGKEPEHGPYAVRPSNLGIFVLDSLMQAGTAQRIHYMQRLDTVSAGAATINHRQDHGMLKPYNDAVAAAAKAKSCGFNGLQNDLDRIKQQVDHARSMWVRATSSARIDRSFSDSSKKSKDTTRGPDPSAAAILHFIEPTPVDYLTNVEEIKASYAYQLNGKPHFAFSMAFQVLCTIKARASASGIAPCQRQFDEMKTMGSSALRALAFDDL